MRSWSGQQMSYWFFRLHSHCENLLHVFRLVRYLYSYRKSKRGVAVVITTLLFLLNMPTSIVVTISICTFSSCISSSMMARSNRQLSDTSCAQRRRSARNRAPLAVCDRFRSQFTAAICFLKYKQVYNHFQFQLQFSLCVQSLHSSLQSVQMATN